MGKKTGPPSRGMEVGLPVPIVSRTQIVVACRGGIQDEERLVSVLQGVVGKLVGAENCEVRVEEMERSAMAAMVTVPSEDSQAVYEALHRRTFVLAGSTTRATVASIAELPGYRQPLRVCKTSTFDKEARELMARCDAGRWSQLERQFRSHLSDRFDRGCDGGVDGVSELVRKVRDAAARYRRRERLRRLRDRYDLDISSSSEEERFFRDEDKNDDFSLLSRNRRRRGDEKKGDSSEDDLENDWGDDFVERRRRLDDAFAAFPVDLRNEPWSVHKKSRRNRRDDDPARRRKNNNDTARNTRRRPSHGNTKRNQLISAYGAVQALRIVGVSTSVCAVAQVAADLFKKKRGQAIMDVVTALATPTDVEVVDKGLRLWSRNVAEIRQRDVRTRARWTELSRRASDARVPLLAFADFARTYFALIVARKYDHTTDLRVTATPTPYNTVSEIKQLIAHCERCVKPSSLLRDALRVRVQDLASEKKSDPKPSSLEDRVLAQLQKRFVASAVDWLPDAGPLVLDSAAPAIVEDVFRVAGAASFAWRAVRRRARHDHKLGWTAFRKNIWPSLWAEYEPKIDADNLPCLQSS